MKKLMMIVLAALSVIVTGCDPKLPDAGTMETTSRAIGVAAGFVASQTKMDADAKAAVTEIMTTVAKVVPAKDQTFEAAWTPVAKEVVAKLVADGKLKEGQDVLVLAAFSVATKAIDYEFNVRYPKAREVADLVSAAVKGFTDGFLSTFNTTAAFKAAPAEMDKEAYDYLTK